MHECFHTLVQKADTYNYPQIPFSNDRIGVFFVSNRGDEAEPFGCYRSAKTEGNYITQITYDMLKNEYELQKDSDGMLSLSFSNETKTKNITGEFSVVPNDIEGFVEVVFGKQYETITLAPKIEDMTLHVKPLASMTYASSQNISRYPKWEEKSLSRRMTPEEWKEYEDMQRYSSKGFAVFDGSPDPITPLEEGRPLTIVYSHATEGIPYIPSQLDPRQERSSGTAPRERSEIPDQRSTAVDTASGVQVAHLELPERVLPRSSMSEIDSPPTSKKIVILGDTAVGKTALCV
jgi:hypothetical protein